MLASASLLSAALAPALGWWVLAVALPTAAASGWTARPIPRERSHRHHLPPLPEEADDRMADDLEHAFKRGELFLHYQPVVDLRTGEPVVAEALLRWRRNGELVSPALFVPVAEHHGLIDAIGAWVLDEAVAQAAEWQQGSDQPLVVSVNVSALQLCAPEFPAIVDETLRRHSLDPHHLMVELTESVEVTDDPKVVRAIRELKWRGVQIAIDDFGTGYASLGSLHLLPLDVVKVDRSFIDNVSDGDGDDSQIVDAVVQLAHRLQLQVVAEGVEDAATVEALSELGCDRVQGFYFARPGDPSQHPFIVTPLSR